MHHRAIVHRTYAETCSIALQVGYKLLLRGIDRVVGRERHERKLTEFPGKMKAETIVGLQLPEGSYAVGALKNKATNPLLPETCSNSEA